MRAPSVSWHLVMALAVGVCDPRLDGVGRCPGHSRGAADRPRHRQQRLPRGAAAQPRERRARDGAGAPGAGLHRPRPRERHQAHDGDGDRRVRAAARRGRGRHVLLRGPRPAGPRAQLPGAGRRGHRFRGRHADRRRRRGARARADDRGEEPGQHRDPRCLPQQPVRAPAAGRVPRPRRDRRGPGDAGGVRHRAGIGGRGRGRQERPVHGGAAARAAGARPQGRGRLQARADQRRAPVEGRPDAVGVLLAHRRPRRQRDGERHDGGGAGPVGGARSRGPVLDVDQGRQRSRGLRGLSQAVSRRGVCPARPPAAGQRDLAGADARCRALRRHLERHHRVPAAPERRRLFACGSSPR